MLKKQLAESILIQLYGGIPSDDARITLRMVGVEINKAIAAAAKKSFYENANLEGVKYANDEFVSTFNVDVQPADDSGFKYAILPAVPAGLPKSRGMVSVQPKKGAYNDYKRIPLSGLSAYMNVGVIPKTIAYWIEDGKVYFHPLDTTISVAPNVKIKMIAPTGNDDMLEEMNLPADALQEISLSIVNMFRQAMGMGIHTLNNNLDIKDAR
jgi:hypothetical protein